MLLASSQNQPTAQATTQVDTWMVIRMNIQQLVNKRPHSVTPPYLRTKSIDKTSTRRSTRAVFSAKALNQSDLLHNKARGHTTPHLLVFRVRPACDRALHKSLHKTLHKSRILAKALNNSDLSSSDPVPVYTPRYPPQSDLGQAHGPVGQTDASHRDQPRPAMGQIVLA